MLQTLLACSGLLPGLWHRSLAVDAYKQCRSLLPLVLVTDVSTWRAQEPYCSQLEAMIVAHVIPAFRSPHGHVRAKANWVTGQYASIRCASLWP